ncbi:hypothetical protein ERO13_D13G021800v2 [Gossypium hirsutum]|nr:hypothetical protein ERO13_D13G021800v2 [Gossypium hirsutum]
MTSSTTTTTATTTTKTVNPHLTFEHKRDAYGFATRPQHAQRYREYANLYREEEEKRSDRWNDFFGTPSRLSSIAYQ